MAYPDELFATPPDNHPGATHMMNWHVRLVLLNVAGAVLGCTKVPPRAEPGALGDAPDAAVTRPAAPAGPNQTAPLGPPTADVIPPPIAPPDVSPAGGGPPGDFPAIAATLDVSPAPAPVDVLEVQGDASPTDAGAPTVGRTEPPPEPDPPPLRLPPKMVTGRLSPEGEDAAGGRISPDGRHVTFHAGPAGKREVWVAAIDGSETRPFTRDPSDDRDPTWTRDGKGILFSSNRLGSYDLFIQPLDGGSVSRLTTDPGDEVEPTVSPLQYQFLAFFGANGVEDPVVDTYEKVAFTHIDNGRKSVRFQSVNGHHSGVISPGREGCWGPRWSGDGLSITWTCAAAGETRTAVHDTRAVWGQEPESVKRALEAETDDEPGCNEDPEEWLTNPCLQKLPRVYSSHAPNVVPGSSDRVASGYSTNQTLVLAAGAHGAATRERGARARFEPLAIPDPASVTAMDWSLDGSRVAVTRRQGDGSSSVFVETVDYPLQDVRDLYAYPELWGRGRSARFDTNRFVVRHGAEKEFHVAFEKVGYANRAVFVTADSVLQIVRDELAHLLKAREVTAADDLRLLTRALMGEYGARPANATNTYLATHFAVAWCALESASGIGDPEPEYEEGEDGSELRASAPDVGPQLQEAVSAALDEVPEHIRERTGALIHLALAHAAIEAISVPGSADPIEVDFTQLKPRGHYAIGPLAGYFVAMRWLSMVPMPLDASAVDLVRFMARKTDEKGPLLARWEAIDALVSGFMGRPIDVTVRHVRDLLARSPALLEPFDASGAVPALSAMIGELGIRGLSEALRPDAARKKLKKEAPTRPFMFFPLRLGLDTTAYSALTHPRVQGRRVPSAVDAMAMLGVSAALRQAPAQEVKYPGYGAALTALRERTAASTWTGDIYHAWLGVLLAVAQIPPAAPAARLDFAASDAWGDRLLSSALGGYAQLKHAAVLYAFEDFSAEAGGHGPVLYFVEKPIIPRPRGFVEPNPAFFRAIAALASAAYAALADGGKEPVIQGADENDEDVPLSGRIVAERLAEMADREVAGLPLREADYAYLRVIGRTFESLFLRGERVDDPMPFADEGRLENGIALVATIHTVNSSALHVAIGRIDDMWVAVPDDVGSRMTQGGVFSFYEFLHPASDRLTDAQWNDLLKQKTAPPRPPWTTSFLDTK